MSSRSLLNASGVCWRAKSRSSATTRGRPLGLAVWPGLRRPSGYRSGRVILIFLVGTEAGGTHLSIPHGGVFFSISHGTGLGCGTTGHFVYLCPVCPPHT